MEKGQGDGNKGNKGVKKLAFWMESCALQVLILVQIKSISSHLLLFPFPTRFFEILLCSKSFHSLTCLLPAGQTCHISTLYTDFYWILPQADTSWLQPDLDPGYCGFRLVKKSAFITHWLLLQVFNKFGCSFSAFPFGCFRLTTQAVVFTWLMMKLIF